MSDTTPIACPRARSQWTPCYLRDGDVVVVEAFGRTKVCVGCEASIERIQRERAQQQQETP